MANRTLTLCACLFLAGCSLEGTARSEGPAFSDNQCSAGSSQVQIYVVDLGWHTGILVPSSVVAEPLFSLLPEFASYPFVEIGWGDEKFYMGPGYSTWSAVRAAFFSHSSVLQVAAFTSLDQIGLNDLEVVRIRLSQSGMNRLSEKILGSLYRDENGGAVRLGDSLYGNGSFYRALGNFSIARTCNSWTSEALKDAGCPIAGSYRASVLMRELQQPLE